MSADIRTVNVDNYGPIKYDSDMPMSSIRGLMSGASDGDLGSMIEGLSSFVTSWPFPGSPSDVESWDALKRSQFNAAVKAIVEDLGALGEE